MISLTIPDPIRGDRRKIPASAAPWRRRSRAAAVCALLIAVTAAGCDVFDRALAVEAPSRIPAAELDHPRHAELLVNGAVGDFDCAFGAYIVLGGIIAGELTDATQTANRWVYDRRDVEPQDARYGEFGCTALGVYTPLSTARWAADHALDRLDQWTDAEMPAGVSRTELIATAANYSGYSHLLLGEGFCTGVLLGDDLTPGGEVDRTALWQAALQKFTRAEQAAQAAGDEEMVNMARVGSARAHLNLGNEAEALADARQVAEGFVRVATASGASARRENRVWAQNSPDNRFSTSVAPSYRELTVDGEADPRVPVVPILQDDGIRTSPTGVEIWTQLKYPSISTPLPIATWDEAQLIIAEIEGGQTAVDIINMFRDRADLPRFESTDEAEIQAQVIEERRRELFLESHRFHDIDRLGLPLDPPPGTPHFTGGEYGDTRCLPLPDIERLNNPRISE